MNKSTIVSLLAVLLVGCGESQKELRLKSLVTESQKQQQTLRDQITALEAENEQLKSEIKDKSESDARAKDSIAALQKELSEAQTLPAKPPLPAHSFAQSRIWTFKKGGVFDGNLSSFRGTTQIMLVNAKDQKLYAINIADLIPADQEFVESKRPQKSFDKTGLVELTAKLIENFPEKVNERRGWIEGVFSEFDDREIRYSFGLDYCERLLGFVLRDKNGDVFSKFEASKKDFPNLFSDLKRGDRIRVVGKVAHEGTRAHWIIVESVDILERAKRTE